MIVAVFSIPYSLLLVLRRLVVTGMSSAVNRVPELRGRILCSRDLIIDLTSALNIRTKSFNYHFQIADGS